MTLPEIKFHLVIEREPSALFSSDPFCVARKWRKCLPIFLQNKGQSSRSAETLHLCSHHGIISFVMGFMHPLKAHKAHNDCFGPKRGTALTAQLLGVHVAGRGEGQSRGGSRKKRKKGNFKGQAKATVRIFAGLTPDTHLQHYPSPQHPLRHQWGQPKKQTMVGATHGTHAPLHLHHLHR